MTTEDTNTTNDHRHRQERDAILEGIARQILKVETLETRRSNALDFYDLAVWSVKEALMVAYDSGFDAANAQKGM